MTSTAKVRKAKKGKTRRKPIDPKKLENLRHKRKVRALFERIGFAKIPGEGIEFSFDGRTGELDGLFLSENILVICEYTTGKATGEHVSKKRILFEKFLKNSARWIDEFGEIDSDFKSAIHNSGFTPSEIQLRIVYASTLGVPEEIEDAFSDIAFLDGNRLRYFDALSKTIHRSCRHEFYKYLRIDFAYIGERIRSSSKKYESFDGYLLPEGHSSYPAGFKVVSFYADPETLLAVSYVLRQDSWRDDEGLYQRILIKSKISRMRKYLTEIKRVFVNNIIVTLPPETQLNDPKDPGKNMDPAKLDRAAAVSVSLPFSANSIGLVDGQHRVFCYYEGKDQYEKEISKHRSRQNLLVTGLIFPNSWGADKRREFEARLFLEINDTQAKAKAPLKQSIELILDPYSSTAIAKAVANTLGKRGPLSDMLQTNVFDSPEKIKTTSIVSYGLKPLVKLEDSDSLFSNWSHKDKLKLIDAKTGATERKALLASYVGHCVDTINAFLIAAKLALGPSEWTPVKKKVGLLTPTVINGFFVCLRRLAESKKLTTKEQYDKKLKGLSKSLFSRYKSSHWGALGEKLFQNYFS